jgi:hypothetical protein
MVVFAIMRAGMKIRLQDKIINRIIINDAIRDLKQKRRPVYVFHDWQVREIEKRLGKRLETEFIWNFMYKVRVGN